jgi:GxxExxY protein
MHEALTNQVIGIFYKVYNELGHGFLESVYENALVVSFREAGLKIESQVPIPVWFHSEQIGDFRADVIVEKSLLLELKAARKIEPSHEAQVLNYLKATDVELALLLNFGLRPEFRRLLFDNERKRERLAAAAGSEK